ncbi:Hypothetical predicted protein [Octopus vulgaris]|uniref:Uncharacterized protein n=1 Tax=Octopus vulgaris TaxID=6645 RepID=A0AA36AG64_OCTVU|nr:Hypothetical predicted protein [Octopus vulgaris]
MNKKFEIKLLYQVVEKLNSYKEQCVCGLLERYTVADDEVLGKLHHRNFTKGKFHHGNIPPCGCGCDAGAGNGNGCDGGCDGDGKGI